MKETQDCWKMFNKIATTYDQTNRVLSFGRHHAWRRKVAKSLPKQENLRVLDLATGTADQLIALFEENPQIQSATGIDLANEMLLIGKQKIENKPYAHKIDLLCADAQKLPFAENLFDAATFSFGIRNMPDPVKSLREIHRTLKPRGKCLILEFSLPPKPIRGVYLLYLRHLLPMVGSLFSKSKSSYVYLNQTIELFPYGDAFIRMMKQAGFVKVEIHQMALGAVSLYSGFKK